MQTRHTHRPLIGITGPDKGGRFLWRCTRFGVELAGGQARQLTHTRNTLPLEHYEGFIIAGGGDINPELYGESAALRALQYDLKRDALEDYVIRYAIQHHVPILGICRGMQMMNVAQGGSLYQEAEEVLEDFLPSKSLISKIIGRRDVTIEKNSRLFTMLGGYEHYRVNSIHHQAINKLGMGIRVVAKEENNLVQAIEQEKTNTHPFLVGVQWHPELMLHASSARRLFKSLIKSAHHPIY